MGAGSGAGQRLRADRDHGVCHDDRAAGADVDVVPIGSPVCGGGVVGPRWLAAPVAAGWWVSLWLVLCGVG